MDGHPSVAGTHPTAGMRRKRTAGVARHAGISLAKIILNHERAFVRSG